LSSLTILAAKARAPASAIRTDEASLSWACTYKARWWIGRKKKKATQKNTRSSDGCVLEICRLPPASSWTCSGVWTWSLCRIKIA
jgi:hypothetical protein